MPALTPWLPHGAVHALHAHQTEHHAVEDSGHVHSDHNHKAQDIEHHPIQLDAYSYYNDHLHVDLRSSEKFVLKAPEYSTEDVQYQPSAMMASFSFHEREYKTSRAPPMAQRIDVAAYHAPLYLTTQRLRI